jgi:hypothetical protein
MKNFLAAAAAFLIVATASTLSADVDKKDIQCVVADKAADMSKSAEYKDGKVYFCCNGCAGKFAKNAQKFAVKANHQLVSTQQYEQKSCPFSGNDLDPEISTMIGKTKVGFCCVGCKGKVDQAKDDEAKQKLVFNDKSFKKAFAKAKKK